MFRRHTPESCLAALSIKTWHERLAHQNIGYVRDSLVRNNIKFVDDWNDHVCEGCDYGKHHRDSHPINTKVANHILDVVHVDLCEMEVVSLGGAKYFLLIDDFSHYKTVYFLKSKDEDGSKLDEFMKLVANQFGTKIKCLKSDNGSEIENLDTNNDLGIFHHKSSVYTPQQNGCVER